MIHSNVFDKAERLIDTDKIKLWCGHPVWLKDDFNELEAHYFESKDRIFKPNNFIDTNRFFFHMKRGELMSFKDKIDEQMRLNGLGEITTEIIRDKEVEVIHITETDLKNHDFIDLLVVKAICDCMVFLFDSPKKYKKEQIRKLNSTVKILISKAVDLGYNDDFILSFATEIFDS